MMKYFAVTGVSFSFLSSALAAGLLGYDAWRSKSGTLLFFSCAMTVQAVCLILSGLRRRVYGGILRTVVVWCVSTGVVFLFSMLTYVHHHGAELWVQAAGVSGVVDGEGKFHTSTPPVPRTYLVITLAFAIAQVGSAILLWRSLSRNGSSRDH